MEDKNNYGHVKAQRILNKFIELNLSVWYMYGLAVMLSFPRFDYQWKNWRDMYIFNYVVVARINYVGALYYIVVS